MRGIGSRAGFAVIVLAMGGTAPAGAAEVPADWRESLASDDALEVIATVVRLAEAGPAAREAEGALAGLLTESQRGKLLSRWSYYALARVSRTPRTHLDRYMKVAKWRPRPKGLGPNEMIVDHGGGRRREPALPEDLVAASDAAWTTCIRAVFERWRNTGDVTQRGRVGWSLKAMRAPPRVMVPFATKVLANAKAPSGDRCFAASLIGTYGHAGRMHSDELVAGLKDPDARVRAACAEAFAWLYRDNCPSLPVPHTAPASVIAAMVEALDGSDKTVRAAVLEGLYWMGRSAAHAEGELIARREALPDQGFLNALSGMGGPRCDEILLAALRHSPTNGAINGLRHRTFVLGQQGRDREFAALAAAAVPVLVEYLKDGRLPRAAPHLIGAFDSHGREAVPVVRDLLRKTDDVHVKGRCIFALSRIGPASADAVPDILRCMQIRKSPAVSDFWRRSIRFGIAIALGRIGRGGNEVEAALLELARSEHRHTRREAAKSLGTVARGSKAVTGALERLLDDEDEDVREEAARAIERVRARAGGAEPTEGIDETF
ncbi:MAG: HEAT repeat domain-containing protein [Planctomycetota bacterium]